MRGEMNEQVEAAVEAEQRRLRTALAAAVIEALRALPEGQAIVRGRIVDGPLTAARLRTAWRTAFPLTDEVAAHLREVLAGEVNP